MLHLKRGEDGVRGSFSPTLCSFVGSRHSIEQFIEMIYHLKATELSHLNIARTCRSCWLKYSWSTTQLPNAGSKKYAMFSNPSQLCRIIHRAPLQSMGQWMGHRVQHIQLVHGWTYLKTGLDISCLCFFILFLCSGGDKPLPGTSRGTLSPSAAKDTACLNVRFPILVSWHLLSGGPYIRLYLGMCLVISWHTNSNLQYSGCVNYPSTSAASYLVWCILVIYLQCKVLFAKAS